VTPVDWNKRTVVAIGLVLCLLVLLVAVLTTAKCLPDNLAQVWIYAITAIAVIAYTVVNWLLVQEVRLQRETQIRPYLVVVPKREPVAFPGLALLNVGNGTALNVQLDPIYKVGGTRDEQFALHHRAIPARLPVLVPHEPVEFQFQLALGEESLTEPARGAALEPSSRWAEFDWLITGSFTDIEGRRYPIHVQTGRSGLKILT